MATVTHGALSSNDLVNGILWDGWKWQDGGTPLNLTYFFAEDGGVSWTLLKGSTDEFRGVTDLVMDPLASNILWASFWGDGIYRSTNAGKSWSAARCPTGLSFSTDE